MRWIGFRQVLRELGADRARVLLVILGVVWGTLSLTVVLSFGDGFHGAMTGTMRAAGSDILLLWSGATTRPHAGSPPGRWIGLLPEDAELLERNVPGVSDVSPELTSFSTPIHYGGRNFNERVHGVAPCYGRLRSCHPEPGGRFIGERDIAERRRVVVLGSAVRKRLFGSSPAVGRTIRIWGSPFTVVGTLPPKTAMSNYEGKDDDKTFIPVTTMQVILGWRYCSYLVVGVTRPEQDRNVVKSIYRVLGTRHGFHPDDEASVALQNQIADQRLAWNILAGTRVLLGIVGVLGLLVALVGVANVTYVMVEERRQEIGVQTALGARPSAILGGFLTEALLLTLGGGVIGIVGGSILLTVFNQVPLGEGRAYLGYPGVSLLTAFVVTGVLALAGTVAGYFPARRAATMEPVEALREE